MTGRHRSLSSEITIDPMISRNPYFTSCRISIGSVAASILFCSPWGTDCSWVIVYVQVRQKRIVSTRLFHRSGKRWIIYKMDAFQSVLFIKCPCPRSYVFQYICSSRVVLDFFVILTSEERLVEKREFCVTRFVFKWWYIPIRRQHVSVKRIDMLSKSIFLAIILWNWYGTLFIDAMKVDPSDIKTFWRHISGSESVLHLKSFLFLTRRVMWLLRSSIVFDVDLTWSCYYEMYGHDIIYETSADIYMCGPDRDDDRYPESRYLDGKIRDRRRTKRKSWKEFIAYDFRLSSSRSCMTSWIKHTSRSYDGTWRTSWQGAVRREAETDALVLTVFWNKDPSLNCVRNSIIAALSLSFFSSWSPFSFRRTLVFLSCDNENLNGSRHTTDDVTIMNVLQVLMSAFSRQRDDTCHIVEVVSRKRRNHGREDFWRSRNIFGDTGSYDMFRKYDRVMWVRHGGSK